METVTGGLESLSWLLPDQRALPDPEQQLFELRKMPGAQLSAPLAFDVPEDLLDLRVGGAAAFGQADNSGTAFIGSVGPGGGASAQS